MGQRELGLSVTDHVYYVCANILQHQCWFNSPFDLKVELVKGNDAIHFLQSMDYYYRPSFHKFYF